MTTSTIMSESVSVTYSLYIESNNEGVEGLSPSVLNFLNIESSEDLSETSPVTVEEVGAGFYKFSYEWFPDSPEAFLIKIETGLTEAPERYMTMRIEKVDFISSSIKRILDIEQGTWEIDSENNELVIKHAVSDEEIGRWSLFDSSGVTGTTRNPFYRRAKTISPY